jgi:3-dehydroquinate synthase
VAVGIVLAFDFSAERELCLREHAKRVRAHLQECGLPISIREIGIAADGTALVRHMLHDKKKKGGRLPFVLARGIGQAFLDRSVELPEVEAFLDRQA